MLTVAGIGDLGGTRGTRVGVTKAAHGARPITPFATIWTRLGASGLVYGAATNPQARLNRFRASADTLLTSRVRSGQDQ